MDNINYNFFNFYYPNVAVGSTFSRSSSFILKAKNLFKKSQEITNDRRYTKVCQISLRTRY